MKFAQKAKKSLLKLIDEMSKTPEAFSTNPNAFTRKRKLSFSTIMRMNLTMGNRSLTSELLEHFKYSGDTPTKSAFTQQNQKLLPKAMEQLFHDFNNLYPHKKKHKEYTLLACDGSDIKIPRNPNDEKTFYSHKTNPVGFNAMHLNALYDVLEKRYTDALVQNYLEMNEKSAINTLVDRSNITGKVILIADRGYESYNAFAHVIQKGWNLLFRVKDVDSSGILSGFSLPTTDEFDITRDIVLTRKHTQEVRNDRNKFKFLSKQANFDFIDDDNPYYSMRIRFVRIKINDNLYETLVTNLPATSFPPNDLKHLYSLRWGIETSFRKLKYTISLSSFHSKKASGVTKEIFASLLMYNFCELISSKCPVNTDAIKYIYVSNFSAYSTICKAFLLPFSPPSLINLFGSFIQPIRPDRSVVRASKSASPSFNHRPA